VDIALVEHAEHDVHGDHRRQDQQQGARQRGFERLGCTLELGLHAHGHADVFLRLVDQLYALAQRHAGSQVERHHHGRKLADMGNGQLRLTLFHTGQARQPHLAAVGGFHMDLVQCIRAEGLAGLGL